MEQMDGGFRKFEGMDKTWTGRISREMRREMKMRIEKMVKDIPLKPIIGSILHCHQELNHKIPVNI